MDADLGIAFLEARSDDQWLFRIQVTNARRPHLGGWIANLHFDVRERRCLELAEQTLHLLFELLQIGDGRERAPPIASTTPQEEGVRRRADADRKEAAVPKVCTDVLAELALVANLAVRHEHLLPADG